MPTHSDSLHEKKYFIESTSNSSWKRIFVDISSLAVKDHGGGIQRFQKSLISAWKLNPPSEYEVIPIFYSEANRQFKYFEVDGENKNQSNSNFLKEKVEISSCDIYLNTDLNYRFVLENPDFYLKLSEFNVQIYFMLYDLLPLTFPSYFPEGIKELHTNWISTACESANFICISATVKKELDKWVNSRGIVVKSSHVNLGADILGATNSMSAKVNKNYSSINFLIVSTIEPRKSHELVLDAFEILWDEGLDFKLIFIGKEGWKVEKLIQRIQSHPLLGKKLFWYSKLRDAELIQLYQSSSALINASLGEGFGLPLVEASYYGLPLILRDIPIFREIAGDEAWYFATNDAASLADSLRKWVNKYKSGEISAAKNIEIVTWQETGKQIVEIIKSNRSDEIGLI